MNSMWQWIPFAFEENGSSLSVDWCFLGDLRFTEPFFDDALAGIPKGPGQSRRTSADALEQFQQFDCLQPDAFIFHSSRCGSTLLTQLLATLQSCIVISEAPVIDAAVRMCHRHHDIDILKSTVRALGQRRYRMEQHYFVKLDAWHINQLPLFRRAFPLTKFYFVYRHPVEILLSHCRERGLQMVPGLVDPDLLKLGHKRTDPADLDTYAAKVLMRLFQSAQQYTESDQLELVNYTQLPAFVWTEFSRHFCMDMDEQSIRTMQERSLYHAKSPIDRFEAGTAETTTPANADVIDRLEESYLALEQQRRLQRIQ